MSDDLTAQEIIDLVKRVFNPVEADERLAIIVDMPDEIAPDTKEWAARRTMAARWASLLNANPQDAGLKNIDLILYQNPHANNADLPSVCYLHPLPVSENPLPISTAKLEGRRVPFVDIFERTRIIIAPTQFSATAPLKIAAKNFGFRAATMPGFCTSMIPALRLDYGVIGTRVDHFKEMLDDANRCDIIFDADGNEHKLTLDLRHRLGHASGGVFPTNGVAGNLPSGESYIVPYEGEINGDPSDSAGELPVQLGTDIVVYKIKNNVATKVLSDNPISHDEAVKLKEEPAYGNMAELGLGVLGDFGLEPTGEILLDEKLGLHIAFGRSEHFGGQVSPDNFSSPDKVVHIDRVYIPQLQPNIKIVRATLTMSDGSTVPLMKNGVYVVDMD